MCVICLDYKRGAITTQEALRNLTELIVIASEEDIDLFLHLEEVEDMLLWERGDDENHETD